MILKYGFSIPDLLAHRQLLDISLQFHAEAGKPVRLYLPAWRPGRYELQHYARHIYQVKAHTDEGTPIYIEKTEKNVWQLTAPQKGNVCVSYQYYCAQMDAGGSWLDDQQLYVNPINCLLYPEDQDHLPCELQLRLPQDWKIACGLPQENHVLKAKNFMHLADSPLMASAELQHLSFQEQTTLVHLWFVSPFDVNTQAAELLSAFQRFTKEQIDTMGDFPEQDYHFLFQVLPYTHYHGVEHRNSTVITIGPVERVFGGDLYKEFLGISSHELFHAWNICKIRPAEMMPYRLQEENYFRTGFVAEGFTTYYGDLFLVRSGVFSVENYLAELNTTLKRHRAHRGYWHMSLAASSFDLWVDGYIAGSPHRKSSIYVEGCLSALILDLEIRKATENSKSLDDVMLTLWNDFGKKGIGYSFEDIQLLTEKIAGKSMQAFFDECITGVTGIDQGLRNALEWTGCSFVAYETEELWKHAYGMSGKIVENKLIVQLIEPGSPADACLMLEDEIQLVNGWPAMSFLTSLAPQLEPTLSLHVNRKGRTLMLELVPDGHRHLIQYKIERMADASTAQQRNFSLWLKQ